MIKLLEIMFQNCIVGIFSPLPTPTTSTPHYHLQLVNLHHQYSIKRASSTNYSSVYSITPAENTRMAGQGKRKYNTMAGQHSASTAGQHSAKYYCHQLLPMVYGLNKSYSKKITIGLENKKIGDEFLPIIRISGNDDFVGIPLTVSDWSLFEENFSIIEIFLKIKIAI